MIIITRKPLFLLSFTFNLDVNFVETSYKMKSLKEWEEERRRGRRKKYWKEIKVQWKGVRIRKRDGERVYSKSVVRVSRSGLPGDDDNDDNDDGGGGDVKEPRRRN